MNAAADKWKWIPVAPKVEMPPTVEHEPRWARPEQFVTLI
jgi:hypothetical protein